MRIRGVAAAVAACALLSTEAQTRRQAACGDQAGLTLPKGFCATVFADGLGPARHLTVTPSGDVFVALSIVRERAPMGSIVGLRDLDGDGDADWEVAFGERGSDDVEWTEHGLFASTSTSVLRYALPPGALLPSGDPTEVVRGLIGPGEHDAKAFAVAGNTLYVSVGAPSNACQAQNRRKEVAGLWPCPLLENAAGVWAFDAKGSGQTLNMGRRVAIGLRHSMGLAVDHVTGRVLAIQHGRDQLAELWPEIFSEEQAAELPSEELLEVRDGVNFGWPYCYHDPFQSRRVLAPEYGGDGLRVAGCTEYDKPILTFPAHTAPNDIVVYRRRVFPPNYRDGAFVALHGGWGRRPFDQLGFAVVFVPFDERGVVGGYRRFAEGFAGRPVKAPARANYRPTGLAVAPEGALFVADSINGRVWRIVYSSQPGERRGARN